MITLKELRSDFLNYFKSKGHTVVKSSSLVPHNDPSLLFTNAGMVQFKDYYTGREKPKFTRACSSQKCVRAGGKHNDLDNVGYTARHHTFFEMLGNFSFGDYFKEDAIPFAWEFLTKTIGLPKEKLLCTIYKDDEEAYKIWKKVAGFSDENIIRLDENFWTMGETGPCGPCSEIFYDHGDDVKGGKPGTPDEDGDRYIEIWNIVFTQFEQMQDGSKTPLKNPNIDTGIGLERLTAVLQGVHNNFEIDLFQKLIENSKNIIGDGNIFSHRIIADHLRSSSFLIADGVLPSNEGRGYVLRRIMRRAMRHIHQLGCKTTSMYKLFPKLVDLMGDDYPELGESENLIMETLKNEEDKFRSTLERGLKILNEEMGKIGNGTKLDGRTAFTLYDTYGFPLDLTQDILREKHIEVDINGFDSEMEQQRKRAKEAWCGSGECKVSDIYFKVKDKVGEVEFVGYDQNTETGKVLSIMVDGKEVNEVSQDQEFEFVVDKTPFYGESGGQIGDSGLAIKTSVNGEPLALPFVIIQINDAKKPLPHFIVHRAKMEIGTLKVGDHINLSINQDKRKKIRANHSAAHLLQYALRKVLGNTIMQKGSYIDEHRLRFDISYPHGIAQEDLRKVENIVNTIIFDNTETKTEVLPIEEAKKKGALALFGEKYEDSVRVLFMGLDKNQENKKLEVKEEYSLDDVTEHLQESMAKECFCSIELCGGTHVKRTGDIGMFKILSEASIASGVRRIEAITGLEAFNYLNGKSLILDDIRDKISAAKETILDKISMLLDENKALKKEIEELKMKELVSIKFDEDKIGNITYAHKIVHIDPKNFKNAMLDIRNKKYQENSIIVAISVVDNKSVIMVLVSENVSQKLSAVDIVKKGVSLLGGSGGGGQPWFAMGGGNVDNVDIAINEIGKMIEERTKEF